MVVTRKAVPKEGRHRRRRCRVMRGIQRKNASGVARGRRSGDLGRGGRRDSYADSVQSRGSERALRSSESNFGIMTSWLNNKQTF